VYKPPSFTSVGQQNIDISNELFDKLEYELLATEEVKPHYREILEKNKELIGDMERQLLKLMKIVSRQTLHIGKQELEE